MNLRSIAIYSLNGKGRLKGSILLIPLLVLNGCSHVYSKASPDMAAFYTFLYDKLPFFVTIPAIVLFYVIFTAIVGIVYGGIRSIIGRDDFLDRFKEPFCGLPLAIGLQFMDYTFWGWSREDYKFWIGMIGTVVGIISGVITIYSKIAARTKKE